MWKPRLSAEFPNDNPMLHDGSIWTCEEPCDAATPRLRVVDAPVLDIDEALALLETPAPSAPRADTSAEPAPATRAEPAPATPAEPLQVVARADPTVASAEAAVAEIELRPSDLRAPSSISIMATVVETVYAVADGEVDLDPTPVDDIVVEELDFRDTVFEDGLPVESRAEISYEEDPAANARLVSTAPPPLPPRAADTPPTAAAPSTDDPFSVFVRILGEVALAAGDARAATRVPTCLEDGDLDAAPDDVRELLAALPTWRGLVRGEDVDMSQCSLTLDEWAAELLSRMMGAPAKVQELKQELRARGVAAFGLLEAA